MRILVDADHCPVVKIIEKLAKEHNIDVYLFYDTSHIINSNYSKVIMVDKGSDSVDYKIVENIIKNDLVITADYGLASMALTKKAYVMNQFGKFHTNFNIDSLLETRAISKKLRKSSKNHIKGPKKRTKDDDINFCNALKQFINKGDFSDK